MDYYHQDRETLGDLPFLSSSHFGALGNDYWKERGFSSSMNWRSNGYRGCPQDLERLQHLLHEQGRKQDGEEDYPYEAGAYTDRADWQQVPIHTEKQHIVTVVSKYKPRFRQSESNDTIPYHEDLLPRWEAFATALKGRTQLQGLEIDNIILPPSSFLEKKMFPALSKNTHLISLQLSNCGLDADGITAISKFLNKKSSSSLTNLDISSSAMTLKAAKSLASAMKKHKELSFVNLSKCSLGESQDVLSVLLDGCGGLDNLVLDDNSINSEEAIALVSAFITDNNTLTVLSMYKNNLGNENAKVLGKALKNNTMLSHLCLGLNQLDLPSIIGSRKATQNLTAIDLSGKWWLDITYWSEENRKAARQSQNKIKMPGVKVLCKLLSRKNSALVELNLSSIGMPSRASKFLGPAMKKNKTLQHLYLSDNSFNNNSVPHFVDALRNNTTLLTLDLSKNNITVDNGRLALLRGALLDISSLQAIGESNHTVALTMGKKLKNHITNEVEIRNINMLDVSEGEKIRLKVVFAMFTLETELFTPRAFEDIPLELMPRLLEIAQQEIGFKGYGKGVTKRKSRGRGVEDPTLQRMYDVIMGWNTPQLFIRGAGKLRKKKRKRVPDEDEDWKPNNRGSGW